MKKIVLTGPESTGKSTLARQLAGHFAAPLVEEYGRTYCERFRNDCDPLDLIHIAAGQLYHEDLVAAQTTNLLICDTDLIVTETYAELYLGTCPLLVTEWAKSRHYDLWLLLDTDLPYVPDGIRLFAERRQAQFNRLREILKERNLPYVVISGNFEERFIRAVEAVSRIL
jgi:NadR type nicotinamide-nucleotide adenylyltransferase